MTNTLEKPVLVITGASSGIGEACARALIHDCRLVLVARREGRLRELCAALGDDAQYVCADLTTVAARDLAQRVTACFGRVDKLLNNAGIFIYKAHAELQSEELQQLFQLNVIAPLELTKALLPQLQASSAAHVINISSHAAESSFANCGAYSASKAALEAWSRCFREEHRQDQIRVSIIAPGATSTEIWSADSGFDLTKMAGATDIAACVQTCVQLPARASMDRVSVLPAAGAL